MSSMLLSLLGLAAVAVASPLAGQTARATVSQLSSTDAPKAPLPTAAPDLVLRQDQSQTTLTLSDCETVADPDLGVDPGCNCANYDGWLPFLTNVADSASCSYTTLVTAATPFPYTTTLANNAIIAYDDLAEDGASTTLQAGTTLTLQVGATSSVNVGQITDSASALYTAISNSLVAACPTPTSGSTVTACASVSPIGGVTYIDSYNDNSQGDLEIKIPLISVSDPNALQMMIVAVAQGVAGNANNPANTAEVSWECDSCYDEMASDWPTVALTNVPALYQAIVSEQDSTTNGAIVTQDMEVEFALAPAHNSFTCSDASLILSGMAALGAIIPGFGWLSLGVVGSELRFGVSPGCDAVGWAQNV
ncbi:hypothetical protein LTR56_014867 [Elasticomyces elasticus]|nr:hypothetical protein LTR56_014867 [Elasticomyces elasticus]KAK4916060.1 hypothetical protein LTR49_015834 [Elasticomyces elasticus]